MRACRASCILNGDDDDDDDYQLIVKRAYLRACKCGSMNLEILLSVDRCALIYRARAPLDLIFRHSHREQRAASPDATPMRLSSLVAWHERDSRNAALSEAFLAIFSEREGRNRDDNVGAVEQIRSKFKRNTRKRFML